MNVAVFVNGSDFYFVQKKMDWWIDAGRLLDWIERSHGGNIVKAAYYQAYNPQDEGQISYTRALEGMGYEVVPFQFDASVNLTLDDMREEDDKRSESELVEDLEDEKREILHNRRQRLNNRIDMEMAVDMVCLGLKNQFDALYLLSGDGIFAASLSRLKDAGKVCHVVFANGLVDRTVYKMAGSNFVDLRTMRNEVSKSQNGKPLVRPFTGRPERSLYIA